MAVNLKRLKLVEIFLVIFFFLFALTGRNVSFFVFVAYMVIASYIGPMLRKISENAKLETRLRQLLYYLLRYGLTIFFIVWVGLRVDKISHDGYYDFKNNKFISLISGIDPRRYPKEAVDFVLNNNINANMFNDFNSGAYLIGRTFPKRKVFIDGRTELYGPEFFKDYLAMMRADAKAFERITQKYNISAILLSTTSASLPDIINYTYKNPHWKIVFFGEQGLVFLKDTPLNKELIDRYRIDFNKYQLPFANLRLLGLRRTYPAPYIKRASIFNLLEEDELVIQEAKEALRIMPNCASAFHLLGKVYLRKGLYQEALENLRATLLFASHNVEALVDLGNCLRELKDTKSAIHAFNGAIRFNKRYAPAYYELGCVYLMENNKSKALQSLNKALKFASSDSQLTLKIRAKLEEIKK